jgi:copper resistance protein B
VEKGVKRTLALTVVLMVARPAFAADGDFPLPPKDWPMPVMDHRAIPFLLIEQLEYRAQKDTDAASWDAQGWFGGDYNKLWLKSEGDLQSRGRLERAEAMALYARLLSPFWYLQAGARADLRPQPWRGSAVVALQGLAPYWFDVEASLFLDTKGRFSGRFEAAYDVLFTQRLIFRPRVETNVAASADEERGLGRWFEGIELGVRLRYEVRRELAPYLGGSWTRTLGGTADLARRAQAAVSELSVLMGLRMWL